MKHFIVLLLCIFLNSELFSRNYYFSSSAGNDSYSQTQAQNPSTPWKTVDKLNSSMSIINPGDSILFKRSDVFYGQINLTRSGTSSSPIVISTYGSGNMPEINAGLLIGSWTRSSGNIWVSSVNIISSFITGLFINGKSQQMGRYPNANSSNGGYLNIDSHSGQSALSSGDISTSVNFTGADAVIRTERWIIEKIRISSHSGKNISLSSQASYEIKNNYGFFIQNHLGTLDENGEWYYDKNSKKIYLYSSSDPNSQKTVITERDYSITATSCSNFIIENLKLSSSLISDADLKYCRNFKLNNCSIVNAGNDGVYITSCENGNMSGNTVSDCGNNGIMVINSSNFTIENNSVSYIGMKAGMGSDFEVNYRGIFINSSNINCEYNTISNIGYNGIQFGGDYITIYGNLIEDFCSILDDGGGIYTASDDNDNHEYRVIEKNTIRNGVGAGYGTDRPGDGSAEGIYLDNRSEHITIRTNIIYSCADNGIFLHNANNFEITGNTVYNNLVQIGFVHDNSMVNYPIRNCHVDNNIFFSLEKSQTVAYLRSINYDFDRFGFFDNNRYCRPADEDLVIKIEYPSQEDNYISELLTLGSWQEKFGHDLNSAGSPLAIPTYAITSISESNKIVNGSFTNNISGWGAWSTYNNHLVENDNTLDGGSLKISFKSVSSNKEGILSLTGSTASLIAGRHYILRFSMLSTHPGKAVRIYLQQGNFPYNAISSEEAVSTQDERKEYELLFTSASSNDNASVAFILMEGTEQYWIDNVKLLEASVQDINSNDYISFFSNPANTVLTVNDGNFYIDTYGLKYHNFSVEPFSSIILFKVSKEYYDNLPVNIRVSSIEISSQNGSSSINTRNGKLQLVASIVPSNATVRSVTWSIINKTGMATVNNSGLVSAVSDGEIDAVATAQDGSGIYDVFSIQITNQTSSTGDMEYPEDNIYASLSGGKILINTGQQGLFSNYSIYGISGELKMKETIPETIFFIDIKEFLPGLYIIILSGLKNSKSFKIVLP
jgi:parallel beta-helix repeat protein